MAAWFMPAAVWSLAFSLTITATAGCSEFFGRYAGIPVAGMIGSGGMGFTAPAGMFNGTLLYDGCS